MNAKTYALWLLGRRAYTEKGLREKLIAKKFGGEKVEKTIAFCKKYKFINDLEFAKNFIYNRDILRPRGQPILRMELLRRGVPEEIIKEAFENSEVSKRDEKDLAKRVVEQKLPQYAKLKKNIAYRRLFALLARRGFNITIIKEVLDDIFKSSPY